MVSYQKLELSLVNNLDKLQYYSPFRARRHSKKQLQDQLVPHEWSQEQA